MLVRSWNLFHGNTSPPTRRSSIGEMVRLATGDHPDVLLLQEVPAWALRRLGDWSGMTAVGDVARRPRLPAIGRALTSLHVGLFRSLFTGQANAILLAPGLEIASRSVLELNPHRRLGTGLGERRICQIVRLREPDLVVANLHTTNRPAPAVEQAARAEAHVREVAAAAPYVLGGDFNFPVVDTSEGIDHILVRGAKASPLRVWPDERRTRDGMLLSDHPPVELDVDL